jgi:glucosylglycerate hydrolase
MEQAFSSTHSSLRDIYPKLIAWHRYLLTDRDPEKSGLVTNTC